MSEEKVKHAYRICPCSSCDVEGIQSWLEDMAAEGLFLVEDGVFGSIFTFARQLPKKVTYRLDVAQKRKRKFMDNGDALTDEELELYRAMGWEYLLQYGDFRIYRSLEANSAELNTETQTHAITINLLKKKHRSSFILMVLWALLWLLCSHGILRYGFRIAASVGLVFTFSVYFIMLWAVASPLLRVLRFRQYEKRLLNGDSLNRRVDWKKTAPAVFCAHLLPLLLSIGVAFGLLSTFLHESTKIPNTDYPGDPPFTTVIDVFPDGTISKDSVWLDYGTHRIGETAISKNIVWNESCDVVTADGENYFCILRLTYHETASEWIAQGLEENYYTYDATRYHGKRFTDLDAPDLGIDSIRVYNNYGTLCVLMREGNRVVYAVVVMDNQTNQNQWMLWAQAMAERLK